MKQKYRALFNLAAALLCVICVCLAVYSVRCIRANEKCREELAYDLLWNLAAIEVACDTVLDETESRLNRDVAFGNIRRCMMNLLEDYSVSDNYAHALSRPTFFGTEYFWNYGSVFDEDLEAIVAYYRALELKFVDTLTLTDAEAQSIINLREEAHAVVAEFVSEVDYTVAPTLSVKKTATEPYLLSKALHVFWRNLENPGAKAY